MQMVGLQLLFDSVSKPSISNNILIRCAVCYLCGSTYSGKNGDWHENYTCCGPCNSLNACIICGEPYNEGDLVIQCQSCER